MPAAQEDVEVRFYAAMLKNNTGDLKIDWEGVANDMGFKNKATAQSRYGQIRKKSVFWPKDTSGSAPSSAGPSPTKVTKSSAKSPAKGRGKKATAKKEEEEVEEPEHGLVKSEEKGESKEITKAEADDVDLLPIAKFNEEA